MSDIKDKYDRMHHRIDPWDEIHRLQDQVKKLKEGIQSVLDTGMIPPDDPIRELLK